MTQKFCKDCTHRRAPAKCLHPNNDELDLVSGELVPTHEAAYLRRDAHLCGPAGNWHEAKPERPAWRVWLARTVGL